MKIRNLISFLLIIVIIFTLSSCGKDEILQENETTTETNTTSAQNELISEQLITETTTTAVLTTSAPETTTQKQLTNAEIIDIYKTAAAKSHGSVKSVQTITLDDITIGGGGAVNSIIKMIKPVINKVVESNSTEFDGITGGYNMLTVADISSISADTQGDNKIIKITLKEQTDKGTVDANSGTVGHAVSVIADLSGVFGQLQDSGMPVEISEENMTMTYRNAEVNVVIDANGNIIKGTWGYVVTLSLENFKVAGSNVANTTVVIRNSITVNGGF